MQAVADPEQTKQYLLNLCFQLLGDCIVGLIDAVFVLGRCASLVTFAKLLNNLDILLK